MLIAYLDVIPNLFIYIYDIIKLDWQANVPARLLFNNLCLKDPTPIDQHFHVVIFVQSSGF
jgi:hypothetical protein